MIKRGEGGTAQRIAPIKIDTYRHEIAAEALKGKSIRPYNSITSSIESILNLIQLDSPPVSNEATKRKQFLPFPTMYTRNDLFPPDERLNRTKRERERKNEGPKRKEKHHGASIDRCTRNVIAYTLLVT